MSNQQKDGKTHSMSDRQPIEVTLDFLKYSMLIAAAFLLGTKVLYFAFIGAVFIIDMFTLRFFMFVKPLHALIILTSAILLLALT